MGRYENISNRNKQVLKYFRVDRSFPYYINFDVCPSELRFDHMVVQNIGELFPGLREEGDFKANI